MSRTTQEGIPYSTFLDNVQSGRVTSVTIQGSDISGVDSEGRSFTTRATDNLDGPVPPLREGGVNFTVKPAEKNSFRDRTSVGKGKGGPVGWNLGGRGRIK